MSRFEVECKFVVKDTETGTRAELVNNTFHVNDKLINLNEMDSYVERLNEGIKSDKKPINYSRFTKFVENFYSVIEETDPEPVETLDYFFNECEANLERLREMDRALENFDESPDVWKYSQAQFGTLLN